MTDRQVAVHIVNIVIIVLSIVYLLSRSVDDNGMDDWDKRWGIAGEGRTRGMFGTVYNRDGSANLWKSLEYNPYWD